MEQRHLPVLLCILKLHSTCLGNNLLGESEKHDVKSIPIRTMGYFLVLLKNLNYRFHRNIKIGEGNTP